MATPTEDQASALESAYQVTHIVRPAANRGGWHQVTSGELDAAAAIGFIAEREEIEANRADTQAAAAQLADPGQPTAAEATVGDAGIAAPTDQSGPLPGNE